MFQDSFAHSLASIVVLRADIHVIVVYAVKFLKDFEDLLNNEVSSLLGWYRLVPKKKQLCCVSRYDGQAIFTWRKEQ